MSSATPHAPLLDVVDLSVEVIDGPSIVSDVSFSLARGEIMGLVGESGSGKTTTALALLGFTRRNARIARGVVQIDGQAISGRSEREYRQLRGSLISYVPQDPPSALNPSFRVARQIREVVQAHQPERNVAEATGQVLERVHLPTSREFLRRYPHQLSGGQQQRLAIALALVCDPSVIVMDEPTTGLDVATQAAILDEVRRLSTELGVGIVYVSHNLAVIGEISDRVAVMYGGALVEQGPTMDLLSRAAHPYTRALLASVPDHAAPHRLAVLGGVAVGISDRPEGCPFEPRCEMRIPACATVFPDLERPVPGRLVRCFEWEKVIARPPDRRDARAAFPPMRPEVLLSVDSVRAEYRTKWATVTAARDVSLSVRAGEAVALVGESGSGKTTLGMCVVGLHAPVSGAVRLRGRALAPTARRRTREERRQIQIIFQNPYDSLNPRRTILDTIARPAIGLRGLRPRAARDEAREWLERVRLPVAMAEPLSRRAVRRRTAARRGRACAGGEARSARLRRGDVGSRRVGAGGGPRIADGATA